jgi:hypothetical protein
MLLLARLPVFSSMLILAVAFLFGSHLVKCNLGVSLCLCATA